MDNALCTEPRDVSSAPSAAGDVWVFPGMCRQTFQSGSAFSSAQPN